MMAVMQFQARATLTMAAGLLGSSTTCSTGILRRDASMPRRGKHGHSAGKLR